MEELHLSLKKSLPENPAVVALDGYLDSATCYKLGDLLDALQNEGFLKLILNFEKLEYISSAGLSVVAEALDKVRMKDGDVKLAKVAPKVLKVVELTGLTKIMKAYPDEESALRSFGEAVKTDGFPKDIQCPKCDFSSKVNNADIFKCPKCSSIFMVDSAGKVNAIEKSADNTEKAAVKLEMWIKSDISYTSILRRFIARIALKEGFSDESVNEIELAVDEAIVNIIEHSYELNPSKNIGITVTVERDKFTVTLTDKGKGFDMSGEIKQVSSSKGPYRGKGITLIKKLMDEVTYTPISFVENKLVLVKLKKEGDKGTKDFIRLE